MMSPVDVRTAAALSVPSGYIVPSGLRSFKESLRGPEAATAFNNWRGEHFTKKLFLALQDMILHQPRETQSDNVLVQLGVTQGLTLAAQLVADPSVLWPDVFGEGMTAEVSGTTDRPAEDFGTTIDESMNGAQ